MFERARASEFVSASARRLLTEGTGANAPAQTVDPPLHPPPRLTRPHQRRATADNNSGTQNNGICASPAYI